VVLSPLSTELSISRAGENRFAIIARVRCYACFVRRSIVILVEGVGGVK